MIKTFANSDHQMKIKLFKQQLITKSFKRRSEFIVSTEQQTQLINFCMQSDSRLYKISLLLLA